MGWVSLKSCRGFLFAQVLAGIALVGVLVGVVYTSFLNAHTSADAASKSVTVRRLLMHAAAELSLRSADLDSDGVLEAPAYVAAAVGIGLSGGGSLPMDFGNDPWGSRFGYCVFDHGSTNSSSNRTSGQFSPSPSDVSYVVISAGRNLGFDTSCADALIPGAAGLADDVLYQVTISQAVAGFMGSVAVGRSVPAVSDLTDIATNSPLSVHDGQLRLVESDNSIWRYVGGTGTWVQATGP